jgi:hypothetical protein
LQFRRISAILSPVSKPREVCEIAILLGGLKSGMVKKIGQDYCPISQPGGALGNGSRDGKPQA